MANRLRNGTQLGWRTIRHVNGGTVTYVVARMVRYGPLWVVDGVFLPRVHFSLRCADRDFHRRNDSAP